MDWFWLMNVLWWNIICKFYFLNFVDSIKFCVSFVYFVVLLVFSLEERRLINFLVIKSDSSSFVLLFGEDFENRKYI